MSTHRAWVPWAAVAAFTVLLLAEPSHAAEDEAVDLLRLSSAKIEQTTALGEAAASLTALTDGDPATVASAAAGEASPLDVVYGFGGETVSPERIRILLPEAASTEAVTGQIEILVSTVSPNAGFRSVRADPLEASTKLQEFTFPVTAARWILLRFLPAAKAARVSVATVEVLGRQGPPKSRYAFAETPAKAFDVLKRLGESASLDIAITKSEAAVFARAQEGPLDDAAFAEAALFASGVRDAAMRRGQLAKIDALAQEARRAVVSGESAEAKGEALLAWLHRGPMAKGYVAGQTDLSVILDEGTFNCVSSATLYNLLARRLGLDARAIEVPDHAFSIVYEGTRHMDVETTTPDGFNPARNRAALERFEETTGFRYIPDRHRNRRREVGAAGLVALIYYNHGVQLSDAGRHHEALVSYFRAMSLDRECASAVKNALAVLANWSGKLAREGAHEKALNVATTGLALAPKDAALRNNHAFVWSEWATSLMDAGRPEDALGILRRAHEAMPDGRFLAMQSWVYIRPGEAHAAAGRWTEALASTEPGLEKLDGEPLRDLERYRAGLHLRWFSAELRANRFARAAEVLDRSLQLAPDDARFLGNTGYLTQEWARHALETEGRPAALAALRALRERYPENEHVTRAAATHVHRVAGELSEKGRHDEALASVEAGRDLLADEKDARQLRVFVWNDRAQALMKQGAWEEAAEVYAASLKELPGEVLLRNNVRYVAQEWTKAAYEKGGDAAVADVTARLAKLFPEVPTVGQAGATQLRRVVMEHVQNGRFEEALEALESGEDLLGGSEDAADLGFVVYNTWAQRQMAAGAWDEAAKVFARALAQYPGEARLKGNVGYLAQEWAKAAFRNGGPAGATEALRTLAAAFPDLEEVREATTNHVRRMVYTTADAGRYEEAIALLDGSKDLLPPDMDTAEIARYVYDRWASARRTAGHWQGAVDAYASGLKRHPADAHLTGNAIAAWDGWARTFMDAKDWDGAIGVYDRALERFPDHAHLKQNRAYCVKQKGK